MKRWLIILSLIAALGFFLRVYGLKAIPLYGDELTIVQDAYSILHTGKDVTGTSYPLTFKMGAGRLPGYVYFSIPFVAIFGESAMGVRGLSLLSGLGIVILMYFLGKRLFSEKLGLVAAFLTTISPWGINLSRGGFEANFALFLALLGVVAFLSAKEKPLSYLAAAVAWGLTLHTYPTYKMTLPIFILLSIWFTGGAKRLFEKKVRKVTILAAAVLLFAGLLAARQTVVVGSEQRFFSINIFSRADPLRDKELIDKILQDRFLDTLKGYTDKFHNRPIENGLILIDNYLNNFSTQFLFLTGDGNPRHNMTQSGILYWAELIFILVGLLTVWTKNKKVALFLTGWSLAVPSAAALVGPPHLLRSSFMFLPLTLISSIGLLGLFESRSWLSKITLFVLSVLVFSEAVIILERLYFVSPAKFAKFWSYSAKRAAEIAIENSSTYDYIFISSKINDSEYAYPVYAGVNANEVIAQNLERQQIEEYEFKKFGNVYIGDIVTQRTLSFLTSLKGRVLFVGDYLNDREGLDPYQDIFAPDDTRILVVRRINGN